MNRGLVAFATGMPKGSVAIRCLTVTALIALGACGGGNGDASSSGTGSNTAGDQAYEVVVATDVVYAQYGARRLQLDIYRPAMSGQIVPGPLPAIVAIRGGGWLLGDKEGFGDIARYLASQGFIAVSISYRTSDETIFPAALHDAKAAVRWMRSNEPGAGASYGVDPNRVGVIGGSAGAHLAAMLATTAHIPEFEGDGGNAGVSSEVRAVVGMATVSDMVALKHQGRPSVVDTVSAFMGEDDPDSTAWDTAAAYASPATYVSLSSAPMLLLHSNADRTIPYEQSVDFKQRYDNVGATGNLLTYDNAPHAFWNDSAWFSQSMEDAVTFFRERL